MKMLYWINSRTTQFMLVITNTKSIVNYERQQERAIRAVRLLDASSSVKPHTYALFRAFTY